MFIFALCCLSGCEFDNPFLYPLLYTVTFDVDGGEPKISTVTCTPGENVALPSVSLTRRGYLFGGWYMKKNGGGSQFTASTPVNADITVYARWIDEKDAVTVTFDADGGNPVPAPIIRAKGETVVLPSPNPAKNNYVFEGWYMEKEGGGAQFTEKTVVTEDITVYAKWVVYPQVTFNADGGRPAKTTASCPSGATVKLPSAPTRTDYIFEGWYTEKEGGGAQFTEKTVVTEDITVYAKWTPYLVVTFDADGGTPAKTTKTCAPGATVKLPSVPRRTDYIFEGWYTEKEGGGKKFTSSTPVNADITVYAKWTPYPRVTFDTDDDVPVSIQICAPGATVVPPSPNPTRVGYVFFGWYTGKDGSGTQFTASTVVTRDITVYARWIKEEDVFTVTFDGDGGRLVPAPIKGIKGETLEELPADPMKDAHTFGGWYTEKEGGGLPFTDETVVTEDITVYAKWTPYLVVTFDTNYGIPSVSTVRCVPHTTVVLPDDPVRTGYTFGGWYTERDGSGTQFTATSFVTTDMTVYAKWLSNITVNGTLELGSSSIKFPNSVGVSIQKGAALTIALSGTNVDWSGATWGVKVDAESVSIIGAGASRIWTVPPDLKNGQYTVTTMIWIGSTLYVGNLSILITN
jgi:uncharacterized repeat protein (TIGR02543 family)